MDFLKGVLLIALIFVPLERMVALHPDQRVFRRGWVSDIFYVLVNTPILSFVVGTLIVGMTITATWLVPISVRTVTAAQPYWLQTIEVIVLADTGIYFVHRALHVVPWLWPIHAVHHSSEEIDWLSAFRNHPVEQIVIKGVSLLPVFMLGFSDVAIGAYLLVNVSQTLFIHANVRIKLGPLRWLWVSPEFHRWHHATDLEARDKNFAAHLPLLDLLFGTFYMPPNKVPDEYGLDQPIPENYVMQFLHPFRNILALGNRPASRDVCADDAAPPINVGTSHTA